MDGPEVIMDAEEYLQPKARGPLPSASAVSSASSPQTTIQFPVGAFGPRNQYLTQRSSEEEGSDHDYYNDLQRELQPLQPLKRNETTV